MRALSVYHKRTVRFIFWAAVIGLVANAARLHQPVLKAALLPTAIVPYTVVLQDFAVKPDGTTVPTLKLTVAVRSDGSRAMEATSSDPASPFSQTTLDFASGKKMYILRHLRLKSTTFDSAKGVPAHWLPDPRNSCLLSGPSYQDQLAGEEVVGAYRTVKLTDGFTTRWLALDYGCALVKDRAEWPDGHKSEKKLLALIPGEPGASMFDDPAGFQEVPPSRFLPVQYVNTADAYYQSHRPADGTPHPQ
jgi:hypothetical protein